MLKPYFLPLTEGLSRRRMSNVSPSASYTLIGVPTLVPWAAFATTVNPPSGTSKTGRVLGGVAVGVGVGVGVGAATTVMVTVIVSQPFLLSSTSNLTVWVWPTAFSGASPL